MNRFEPDRVPIQCHFTPEIQELLEEYTGRKGLDVNIAMGDDAVTLWEGMALIFDRPGTKEGEIYRTPFGVELVRRGYYNEILRSPLESASSVSDIEAHPFPEPVHPARMQKHKEDCDKYKDVAAIIAAVPLTIFEGSVHLRGNERFLEDLLWNRAMAELLMDRVAEFHRQVALWMLTLDVDILWLGDDVGTQKGMLIAPDLWRRTLKPRMRRLIGDLKTKRPGVKIAYHSDGGIRPIIGDLIDIGVDILNPVQPGAEGMDSLELKRDFGRHLSFWGGVDQQHVLPFGDPADVRQEVAERIRAFAPGGGYMLSPTHNIQPDTKLENILALYDAMISSAV